MTDIIKITLKNCSFYAYHGVFEEEKKIGQRFFVDVEMDVTKSEDIADDQLENTVHYGEVFALVEDTVTNTKYDLIETLAHFIGQNIIDSFNLVQKAKITVRKPSAPIQGVLDHVEVCIETAR
ncbi:MAG: dihydroneopterin aldolase [Rhizobiaceae bacterium]|nr:dihydroneopterin aldolase [Rhizobiaceae bacterium]